jgi:hypothetical protein
MHYKDGTEAKIGDYVKGVPYNTGGEVIVGRVTQLTAGTDSCNLQVLYVEEQKLERYGWFTAFYSATGVTEVGKYDPLPVRPYIINLDYGQTNEFELVHRP